MNGIAPMPSPPAATPSNLPLSDQTTKAAVTPPVRASSPRIAYRQLKKFSKKTNSNGSMPLPAGLLDGTVPPINVLIVEDNTINLKLLEAFMKRLKVRWQTAMNGREAVNKWRQGGFHLVLMDIQLPVMNGLDATTEIRRLERLNGIGVFSRTVSGRRSPITGTNNVAGESKESTPQPEDEPLKPEDTLENKSMFRSPVIIVALTASSLQSDRHEALAAGCNDFLTKVCLISSRRILFSLFLFL
jgi:osomolarity two-component system response regulator SSK1